jgi:hypothetical protein
MMFPRRQEKITIDKVEINPKLDASLFMKPQVHNRHESALTLIRTAVTGGRCMLYASDPVSRLTLKTQGVMASTEAVPRAVHEGRR